MPTEWGNDIPIYKQLESRLITWVLQGEYPEGESLPSVRTLSVELQINHLTVAKAFQALVDLNVIEKRRGLGMFVREGAINTLFELEKTKFLNDELPHFLSRMHELKLSFSQIEKLIKDQGEPS